MPEIMGDLEVFSKKELEKYKDLIDKFGGLANSREIFELLVPYYQQHVQGKGEHNLPKNELGEINPKGLEDLIKDLSDALRWGSDPAVKANNKFK